MCCFYLLAMNKSRVVLSAIPYHLSNPKISILISNFSRFDVYTDAVLQEYSFYLVET